LQPTYITISTLFSSGTRHTVPLFQRPYVWSREEQWEPLWEDIEGLLSRLETRNGDASIASHFLGTVVLEQVQNQTGIAENVSPADRNWALHGIGNLTLVSQKLNPTMSNSPWIDPAGKVGKQESLRKHTRLEINRRLLENYPVWNDDAIESRSREMFSDALAIWPR